MKLVQLATAVCLVFSLLFVGADSGVVNNSPEHPATKYVLYEPEGGETAVDGGPGKIVVNWCQICVVVVEWLDSYLINETETALFYFFDKVCALLPASLQTDCSDLANQIVPIVTQLLLEEVIPVSLCKLLTVCSTAELDNLAVSRANGVQLGALKEKEVDLQRIADSACAVIPYKYNALCREVLKTGMLQQITSLIKPRK